MPLILRSKTPVRFEWADGEVESTVTLSSEDDQDALVRKLRRIVGLVEGVEPPPVQTYGLAQGIPPNAFRAAAPHLGEAQIKNGWEMIPADELDVAPGEAG